MNMPTFYKGGKQVSPITSILRGILRERGLFGAPRRIATGDNTGKSSTEAPHNGSLLRNERNLPQAREVGEEALKIEIAGNANINDFG